MAPVGVAAGAVGACIGALLGRRHCARAQNRELRKVLGTNWGWMTEDEKAVAAGLLAGGHRHMIAHWAPSGSKDEQKRALLRAVATTMTSHIPSMETERLATLAEPFAPKQAKQLPTHGDIRVDEFYWLRDDSRKSKKVLEHLRAENEYTQAVLAGTSKLQEALYQEMRGRIKEDDESVPERLHGFFYYTRNVEGLQYKIHCRRRVSPSAGAPTESDKVDLTQPEEVLLDENRRKEEGKHTFYMVGAMETSPDQTLLAFAEDTVGGERFVLRIKDLASGAEIMEGIKDTSGDVEWANDNKTIFYTVKDSLDRPYKVLRHEIGQPASSDAVVYEEKDESFYVGIGKSRSEKCIFIQAGSAVTSETMFIPADAPHTPPVVVLPRKQDVEYSVSHRGEHFYITIRDAARTNSELVVAPMASPQQQTVLLPHDPQVKLEGVSLSQHFMAVFDREGGLQRARVFTLPKDGAAPTAPLDARTATQVDFDEPAYSLGGSGTGDFDSPLLRLGYTSLTTPSSVIDYNMGTGARMTKKEQPVLGGFDKTLYTTERLWATSHDGTKVPVSIVYRKGVAKLDGSAPLLLDGYGSYEISNDPYFSSNRLCLLDRGFVFAVAHIRGGGEMGRQWYEDGKYLNKKNTFLDFIAAAEHLIAMKYTTPARLCIEGRSAGGLLMGAVVNMRPELFCAAIMGVPFVDALTTMLDDTIPLTIIEWEEWGNPMNKEFYEYMASYSPVDNIRSDVAYPHILATGGLHDPRVGYWEPAKFVARLRAARPSGDRLLLLKMELGAGHFSVTGRFDRLKETAFEYAFLLKVQGMLHVEPTK